VRDDLHVLVLGRVREDVIRRSPTSAPGRRRGVGDRGGIVGGDLVFSVRNVGYVRAAGEVVRAVVEGLGVGGGIARWRRGSSAAAFRKTYAPRHSNASAKCCTARSSRRSSARVNAVVPGSAGRWARRQSACARGSTG
jgi:hypothetical protein